MSAALDRNIRFGPFELDVRCGELRKGGIKVRLPDQPFQILLMLLERPGDLISRDEIRSKLWPGNTVVEFDHSINAAVKRLRNALCDSAEKSRYIETLTRRGYRFIGEVETADNPIPSAPVTLAAPAEPVALATTAKTETVPSRARWDRPRIFVPAALAVTVLILWAGSGYFRRGAQPLAASLQPLMRLDLDLRNDASPSSKLGANAIVSRDGTRLVYVSHSKLFTRRLDQANATELPGTEEADAPFFSPDGQWVGFFAAGILKKVSLQGGRAIVLCKSPAAGGGSWGENGNIIASLEMRLFLVSPAGGRAPAPLTELAAGEIVHRWPQILPGGKAVLFSAYTSLSGLDGATIQVLSLRDGRRKTLLRGGTYGRYMPSGHLVYIDKGTLFAVPFDLDRLEMRGTPTPVLEDIAYSAASGSAQIDFSRTGALLYRSSLGGGGLVTVQWLDESGRTQSLLPVPGNYLSPTLSPDANWLALTSAGDIWVYELGRGHMKQLTFGGGYSNPLWTADGRYIVFRASKGMWWTRADGTGQPQPLFQSENHQIPWSFTADGKRLAFDEVGAETGGDLWTVPVDSDESGLRAGKPEVFLQTRFNERAPMFSPDGRWIAYQSDESGRYQVYVQAFPKGLGHCQISIERSMLPSWSRNGRELFFRSNGAQNRIMVASYQARGDSFVAEKPRVWSENAIMNFSSTRSYDPAPDGKRIVALMPADAPQDSHAHVILLLNFFDELRRRVPSSSN